MKSGIQQGDKQGDEQGGEQGDEHGTQLGTRATARRPLPSRAEVEAWRAFLRAHAALTRQLEDDLLREHQLPLAMYDVLVQLVENSGRLRMTDLADAVLISRSGLTRLVDRMATAGYVRREPSPEDARGVLAVLTDAGFARLKAASPTHLAGIGSYVVDRLDPDELKALGRACEKLAAIGPG